MSESTNYLLGKMDAQDLMLGKTDDDASNFSALSKNGYGYFAPVLSAHFGALAAGSQQDAAVAASRTSATESFGKPQQGEITVYPEWDGHYKGGTSFSPANNLGSVSYSGGLVGAPSELLVDGTIGGGEIDAYSVNLVAGETYFFSAYGSGANPLGDTFLYIIDNTGAGLLDYDDDGGAGVNSVITYTATYTGLHYVGVGAYPGSGLTGDYTLDLFEFPDADFVSDTFEDAPVLPANGVTYGFIDGGPEGPYAGYSEVDTYAIQVEAGKIYSIEVAGGADYESDFLDLRPGELDTILQLFDSEGNFVAGNDDISFPGDVSSRISFIATESGTYYLDVLAYLNLTSGEFQAGGYTLTTQEVDPADLDPVDALIWESAANVEFDETNTAYVYFAAPGESLGETADDGVSPLPSFGWNAYEIEQVMLALEEYEKILGVNYEITNDVNQATFRLITTESQQYGAYFYPQDPGYGDAQGIGAFNVLSGGWAFDQQQALEQGGFSFAVILHEFGHAHGLAHPHDQGGGSDVLLGVTASQGSLGLYDLNQGVYTVMSYNDAWQLHPDGPSPFTADGVDNGWSGTLSAFDIAALQQRYGVNNPYATGNTTYQLKDANEQGTYYETIWDTGGTDVIRYDGSRNARIDLLAATIDYSPTGGGVLSFVDGIWGGYTIAEGVVIENATGGGGNDALLGNAANNVLT
ncbi:MAG: pre-peptidase C-terminal domain-containing protein, partial [Amphiplicatus sp.]